MYRQTGEKGKFLMFDCTGSEKWVVRERLGRGYVYFQVSTKYRIITIVTDLRLRKPQMIIVQLHWRFGSTGWPAAARASGGASAGSTGTSAPSGGRTRRSDSSATGTAGSTSDPSLSFGKLM